MFDDSFTRGQPPISVTGHWLILSYMYNMALYTIFSYKYDHNFFSAILTLLKPSTKSFIINTFIIDDNDIIYL